MENKIDNKFKDIIHNSAILIFVRVITMSVNIIQTMILSRTLTKTDYGTYSQALLIISFFSPFFSLGLENAVNYFFNKPINASIKERYINTIFFISIFCGLFCGLIILTFQYHIVKYFGNTAVLGLIMYIAFRPCLQNLISLYHPLFISCGYAKTIAIRNLIISILQVAIVGGVSFFAEDIALILLLLLLLDIAQLICFDIIYRKREFTISVFRIDFSLIESILKYALPMLLATSIGTISINIDKLMLSGMMTIEDYALYSNVSKELPLAFIINCFTSVVAPIIIQYINAGEYKKFKFLWSEYLELGYKVTWPLAVGMVIFAPELIEVLYSKAYLSTDGVAVFRVYSVAVMLRFTYFGMVPTALGRTDIVLKYSGIGCIINICLNYPMYILLGTPGPAVATVTSMIISAILYFRTSAKLVNISLTEVLNPRKIIILVLEMLICGLIIRRIIFISEIYFKNVFINLALGYFLFNCVIWGLNFKDLKALLISMKREN